MRTICDVCENAAAIIFCAADEAALCQSCDDKVHMCNKLASRHVRVGLANPSAVPRCDICENAPAFFYCEVDGSSLCLQCDMTVHVGGKRSHGRYLVLRQRVQFPGYKAGSADEPARQPVESAENRGLQGQSTNPEDKDDLQNGEVSVVPKLDAATDAPSKMDSEMIDLNMKPHRLHAHTSNTKDF